MSTDRMRKMLAFLMILTLVLAACAQATPTPTTEPTEVPATEEATEVVAEAATEVVTEEATEVVTEEATEVVTEEATEVAMLPEDPTEEATVEATEVVTEEATKVVTEEATEVVTEEATVEATEVVTEEATVEATLEVTEVVTEEATVEATVEATEEATLEATLEATVEATAEAANTIVDIAVGNEDLSILLAAVQAADLAETLAGDGPFTVLAPTNEAFEALLETLGMTADELLANTDLLTQVLLYHVRAGVVTDADILERTQLLTLNGATIIISGDDAATLRLNDAEVIQANIEASNGIIHVIDTVLLPPDLDLGGGTMETPTEEATAEATPES